ncbi:MAG: hypothetical protein AAGJ81_10815 [Verrucomicrobiota bacterium]
MKSFLPRFSFLLASFASVSAVDSSHYMDMVIIQESGLPAPIGGPIDRSKHEELRRPITIWLENNREFQGTLAGVDDERISLRLIQDGGEVLLSFPVEEIKKVFFPGERVAIEAADMIDSGEYQAALPYLESIIGARFRLFPFLPPEEKTLFRFLPLAALSVDNPAQAIAYVRALRPFLSLEGDQDTLRDVELRAYYELRLMDEASKRAQDWIEETERYGESALGQFILASIQFEKEEFEEALFTVLQPIVFSGEIPVSFLSHCYSIAIASSELIGDVKQRDELIAEMIRRGIEWKPLEIITAHRSNLANLVILDAYGTPIDLFAVEDEFRSMKDNPENGSYLDPSGLVPL